MAKDKGKGARKDGKKSKGKGKAAALEEKSSKAAKVKAAKVKDSKVKPAKVKPAKVKPAKVKPAKAEEATGIAAETVEVGAAPEVYELPLDVDKVDKDLRPDRPISEVLRVGAGFTLADFDASSTPGFDGSPKDGEKALAAYAPEIGEWQERLFAETKGGGTRSLLIVLQGLDSAGKGGIVRHVMSNADPAGIKATAFKAPTEEERQHEFLWRIRKALPGPGQIGVFDRSHYEDVLIVRALNLAPRTVVGRRYATINAFERGLVAGGTQVLKVFLYIDKDEQRARLMERLDRPDKHYKYTPGDTDNRAHWDAYMEAFQVMFDRTSTEVAPWYIIPANNKWYARYAVQQLLLEKLRAMDPDWPKPDYDVEAEKARLAVS